MTSKIENGFAKELENLHYNIISRASHDLRTPLTTIMGFSELLSMNKDSSATQRAEWARMINRESILLSSVIDEAIELFTILSGSLNVAAETLNVTEVVSETVASARPITASREIAVVLPGDLPPVIGDKDKLVQVLTNLLANEIKYGSSSGSVHLGVGSESDGSKIIFSIAGQDLGIAPTDRTELFESLLRRHRPEATEIREVGLGLYTAWALTTMMGGEIWIERGVDQGSTIFISLPARLRKRSATTDPGKAKGEPVS